MERGYPCPRSSVGAFNIVNFILILIVIIAVVAFFLLFQTHRNSITKFGISYKIQDGVTSGTTDSMTTGGNNLYIVNSSSPLTLTVMSSTDNQAGRIILIKNNTSNNTTLVGESGKVTLNSGQLNLTVTPGQTAYFLNTDGKDMFLRLQ